MRWLSFQEVLKQFDIPNQIEMAQKVWKEFQPMVEKEIKKNELK